MNYTFFAIACYIIMRGMQVLLEEHQPKPWYKLLMRGISAVTIYSALAAVLVWYQSGWRLLVFDPSK